MSNMSVFIQAYFIENKAGTSRVPLVSMLSKTDGRKTIDGERLNTDLQLVLDSLSKEDYAVVSITPITSADYQTLTDNCYGYSYTEGLIVVARKI